MSALDTQVGGDHYKKLGDYQPWEVLRRWLTPEEFHGYLKGSAIAYLARERDKGGNEDIGKAMHTLQALLEFEEAAEKERAEQESESFFTPWCGGSQPLFTMGKQVEIKKRDGSSCVLYADRCTWLHGQVPWDIVAFRLLSESQESAAKHSVGSYHPI